MNREPHRRSSGCAAIDPQLELLAAAFTCGQLVVLTFPEGAEKHRSNLWPKAVSGSDHLRLAWQPNGTDPREDALTTSVWVKQLLYLYIFCKNLYIFCII